MSAKTCPHCREFLEEIDLDEMYINNGYSQTFSFECPLCETEITAEAEQSVDFILYVEN